MKRSILILLFLVLTLSTMAVYAFNSKTSDENDPLTNPDANACFIGGSMVGKCGDSDLFWNAGWYLVRFEQSIITRDQVPDQYKWILPKEGMVSEASGGKPVLIPTNPPAPPV